MVFKPLFFIVIDLEMLKIDACTLRNLGYKDKVIQGSRYVEPTLSRQQC